MRPPRKLQPESADAAWDCLTSALLGQEESCSAHTTRDVRGDNGDIGGNAVACGRGIFPTAIQPERMHVHGLACLLCACGGLLSVRREGVDVWSGEDRL